MNRQVHNHYEIASVVFRGTDKLDLKLKTWKIWTRLTNITLTDKYRARHPTTGEHILFWSTYKTVTKIDRILSNRVTF